MKASAPDGGLPGGDFDFAIVSVGATENALMAAVLCNGTSRLINAAREPEIVDLCRLLTAMGAEIEGIGTSELTIHGAKRLHGATYRVMPDRIEAGSYACAAAITGGEDGLNYSIPRELTPAFRLGEVMGVRINGKLLNYYLVFTCCLVLFLVLLRVVNSPFGRVLQAIRENEFRAEAIGYRVVYYRIIATCLSASVAALAGSLFAIWLRYVGPDTTLSFTIMLDILLMVVIGGMGTIYGAVIGAAIFVLAQNYLQTLMGSAAEATAGLPLVPDLLNPDRWLLWLGVLFILSVYFFPTGIVGRLRTGR